MNLLFRLSNEGLSSTSMTETTVDTFYLTPSGPRTEFSEGNLSPHPSIISTGSQVSTNSSTEKAHDESIHMGPPGGDSFIQRKYIALTFFLADEPLNRSKALQFNAVLTSIIASYIYLNRFFGPGIPYFDQLLLSFFVVDQVNNLYDWDWWYENLSRTKE